MAARSPTRWLLPAGFTRMRDDVGAVLRGARREARQKQHVLADAVGIARETLSRIETGRSSASPATMDALLAALELDWHDVAIAGDGPGRCRPLDDSARGDALLRLGQGARARRRELGVSLERQAALLGVSASQLSRVERGYARRGRLIVEDPHDRSLPFGSRGVRIRSVREGGSEP